MLSRVMDWISRKLVELDRAKLVRMKAKHDDESALIDLEVGVLKAATKRVAVEAEAVSLLTKGRVLK